jgi:uncharacterized protein (TIGR02996 family)
MTPEDAFLAAVLDDPDSDTPRLIFADWLEEHGQPQRADFIRAQCRLAALDEYDPARLPFLRAESAYLPRAQEELHEKKGFGKLPIWVLRARPGFERGFPARLATTAARFLKGVEDILCAAPIQHLSLDSSGAQAGRLFGCEHLTRVRSLDLRYGKLGDRGMQALERSPYLGGLRRLGLLGTRLRISSVTLLARAAGLAGLRHLDLSYNHLYDRGLEALADSPYLHSLESLHLDRCHIGPRSTQALARSAALSGLRELSLMGNDLTDFGAFALAESPHLARLARLDVTFNGITTDGARALLTSRALTGLERLGLGYHLEEDALSITPAAHLCGRLHLRLQQSPLLRGEALARSSLVAACAGLEVIYCDLGDQEVAVLARSPVLAGLEALSLEGEDLHLQGVRALARSPHLGKLRRLSLAHNSVDLETLDALLEAPFLSRLTHLDLSDCGIPSEAYTRLARCAALEDILQLRLSANISPEVHDRDELWERFGTRVRFN